MKKKKEPKNSKEYIIYSHYMDEALSPILGIDEIDGWLERELTDELYENLEIYEIKPAKLNVEKIYRLYK